MLLGLTLLYVGAVLFVNGIWLCNKIANKEVAVLNFLVGFLSFLIACYLVFHDPQDARAISTGAFTFLFAFTYLWVGANQFLNADGSGLGWFCLFVGITVLAVALSTLDGLGANFGLWNLFNWLAWAALWLCFFILLALKKDVQKMVGGYTLFCAIFTGWIPGLLILNGYIAM